MQFKNLCRNVVFLFCDYAACTSAHDNICRANELQNRNKIKKNKSIGVRTIKWHMRRYFPFRAYAKRKKNATYDFESNSIEFVYSDARSFTLIVFHLCQVSLILATKIISYARRPSHRQRDCMQTMKKIVKVGSLPSSSSSSSSTSSHCHCQWLTNAHARENFVNFFLMTLLIFLRCAYAAAHRSMQINKTKMTTMTTTTNQNNNNMMDSLSVSNEFFRLFIS